MNIRGESTCFELGGINIDRFWCITLEESPTLSKQPEEGLKFLQTGKLLWSGEFEMLVNIKEDDSENSVFFQALINNTLIKNVRFYEKEDGNFYIGNIVITSNSISSHYDYDEKQPRRSLIDWFTDTIGWNYYNSRKPSGMNVVYSFRGVGELKYVEK